MLFRDIIGQNAVKQRLISSVKENRVSHAQLFLGPEGSGNLALAVAYAQYLCCENKGAEDSCGICSSCIKLNKLVHPDVTFTYPVALIDKKKTSVEFIEDWRKAFINNPYITFTEWLQYIEAENKQPIINADESQDIIRRLSLKSFESGYKIVIIWLPEKMNPSAANKLLKILEEPPEKTLFVLVAENYEELLPTILSRAQLIKVNRISDEDMTEALMTKHQLGAEEARRITHLADGSYHEALLLTDKENEEEDHAKVFLDWMRLCYQRKYKELINWVDDLPRKREQHKNFLQYALHLTRECIVISNDIAPITRMSGKELEDYRRFAPFVNNNAEQFAEELNKAYFHIERNANHKILFMDLSLKMSQLLHTK
jgi:DNA polymerase III subunit delta'